MNDVITNRSVYWDRRLDKIIDESLLNKVTKFHQSGTLIFRDNQLNPHNIDLLSWLQETENTDQKPNHYLKEIKLNVEKVNFHNTKREFSKDRKITLDLLGKIVYMAFGRSIDNPSKRYPSAGAIYPIIPILYVLDNRIIEGVNNSRGCYTFDTGKNSLVKFKEWNNEEFEEFKLVINSSGGEMYTNLAIGYAIDLKRAIAKYKERGYRHALIEVGLMAQSLKESLIDIDAGMGELCWSSFDDNALTYSSGLNPKNLPISLVQWFGFIGGVE